MNFEDLYKVDDIDINKELLMLFSTSYGAVITYFFTKKKENKEGED